MAAKMVERPVVIIGAGLSGSLMAVYLAHAGYTVELYERRGDGEDEEEGRSINLGLSARGILALERAGLWDKLAGHVVPMRGRVIHRPRREPAFQPYGISAGEILYSVKRAELNRLLRASAAEHAHVRIFHDAHCTGVDRESGVVSFADGRQVAAAFVIGADGAFSQVRRAMQHGLAADYRQDFLPWGYKELTIAPGTFGPALEALHVWPAEGALMVAHPNGDGSLTATLFLPREKLEGMADVRGFFAENFPGALAMIPDLAGEFARHPAGHLVSVRTTPWRHKGRVVLVGDACHAVYPFYGQGMNSAFEDCVVLADCLRRAEPGRAFAQYERLRRPHTDVLAELSEANFHELRDGLRSPLRLARKQADLLLARLFPDRWVPLYTMISHTTTPYADALRRARRQDRVMAAAGAAAGLGAAAAAYATLRRWSRR